MGLRQIIHLESQSANNKNVQNIMCLENSSTIMCLIFSSLERETKRSHGRRGTPSKFHLLSTCLGSTFLNFLHLKNRYTRFAPCKRIQNPANFCSRNLESTMVWNPESTLVWNPESTLVWNPESRRLESGIQRLESRIQMLGSGI